MTKQEMTALLRSVGVSENTVTAMENAYDMGVEHERARCVGVLNEWIAAPLIDKDLRGILADIQDGNYYR